MPITQTRMVALINAARDYKQAYEQTRQRIEEHCKAVMNGTEQASDALQSIYTFTGPQLMVTNLNSAATIEVEHAHFKSHSGRNNRAAKSARRKRLGAIAPSTGAETYPETTHERRIAPETLISSSKLIPPLATLVPQPHQQQQPEKKQALSPEEKKAQAKVFPGQVQAGEDLDFEDPATLANTLSTLANRIGGAAADRIIAESEEKEKRERFEREMAGKGRV